MEFEEEEGEFEDSLPSPETFPHHIEPLRDVPLDIDLESVNLMKKQIVQIVESFYGLLLRFKRRRQVLSKKYESIHEQLLHLEELNDKFFKLEFIKNLSRGVKNLFDRDMEIFLKSTPDEEFLTDVHPVDGPLPATVEFTEVLASSTKFEEYVDSMKNLVLVAIDDLIEKDLTLTPISPSAVSQTSGTSSIEWEKLFSHNISSASSENDPAEIVRKLSEDLNIRNSLLIRRHAIGELEVMNTGDLLFNENWTFFLKQLTHSFADTDPEIVRKVFKLHIKLFKFAAPEQAMQIYMSFLNHINWVFESQSKKSFASSIDPDCEIFDVTFKKMKFFLWMQEDLEKWWGSFHYAKFLEYFTRTFQLYALKFLNLFELFSEKENVNMEEEVFDETKRRDYVEPEKMIYMSFPFSYICLVDINAKWFNKWVSHSDIRQNLVSTNPQFFRNVINLLFFPSNNSGGNKWRKIRNYQDIQIFFYLLNSSISVVLNLLTFSETKGIVFEIRVLNDVIHCLFQHFLNFFDGSSIFLRMDISWETFCSIFQRSFTRLLTLVTYPVLSKKNFQFLLFPLEKRRKEPNVVSDTVYSVVLDMLEKILCHPIFLDLFFNNETKVCTGAFSIIVNFLRTEICCEVRSNYFGNVLSLLCRLLSVKSLVYYVRKMINDLYQNDGVNLLEITCQTFSYSHNSQESLAGLNDAPKMEPFNDMLVDFITGCGSFLLTKLMSPIVVQSFSVMMRLFFEYEEVDVKETVDMNKKFIKIASYVVGVPCSFDALFANRNLGGVSCVEIAWRDLLEFCCRSFEWEPKVERTVSIFPKHFFQLLFRSPHFLDSELNQKAVDQIFNDFFFFEIGPKDNLFEVELRQKVGLKTLLDCVDECRVFLRINRKFGNLLEHLEVKDETENELGEIRKNLHSKIKGIYFTPIKYEKKKIEVQVDTLSGFKSGYRLVKDLFTDSFKFDEKRGITKDESCLGEIISEDEFLTVINFTCSRIGFDPKNFLSQFQNSLESIYMWYNRGKSLFRVSGGKRVKFEPILIVVDLVDFILRVEYPVVFNFLSNQLLSVSVIVFKWIKQFFVNYLEFDEILEVLKLVFENGIDYLVYLCVVGFVHVKETSGEVYHVDDFSSPLNWNITGGKWKGFRVSSYRDVMEKLEGNYRKFCLSTMIE